MIKQGSQIQCTTCATPHTGKVVAVIGTEGYGIAWDGQPVEHAVDAVFCAATRVGVPGLTEAQIATKHGLTGMAATVLHCSVASLAQIRQQGVTSAARAEDLGTKLNDAQLFGFCQSMAEDVAAMTPKAARRSLDLDELAWDLLSAR